MYCKSFVLCIGLCLILCLSPIDAKQNTIIDAPKMSTGPIASSLYERIVPDLKVTSLRVTSAPFVIDTSVLVPLQITIKNMGSADVTQDFYVGAYGFATDGNVQGFSFGASGEVMEANSIVVKGLDANAQKTYNGILMLKPAPEPNPPFLPGSSYEIEAMVDLNMDPDFSGAIGEKDETNNRLKIKYPLEIGTMMMGVSPANS